MAGTPCWLRGCDRVLWVEKGELLMDGPTDEVIKAYEKHSGGQ